MPEGLGDESMKENKCTAGWTLLRSALSNGMVIKRDRTSVCGNSEGELDLLDLMES